LIDQDPEFIGFLQSLTDPVTTKLSVDADNTVKKEEKVTVTPLVQYLKDKKASKGKDGAGRGSRHGRAESKDKSSDKHTLGKTSNQATAAPDKRRSKDAKADKVARDAIKVLNREAGRVSGAKGTAAGSEKTVSPIQPKSAAAPTGPAADKRRERGNAAAAARILQRDLGLAAGGSGRRRGGTKGAANENVSARQASSSSSPLKQNAVLAGPTIKASESSAAPLLPSEVNDVVYPPEDEQFVGVGDLGEKEFEAQGPAAETAARDAAERSKAHTKAGPVPQMILKKPPSGLAGEPIVVQSRPSATEPREAKTTTAHQPKAEKAVAAPNQAFLKHANPSQGITEPLIQSALEVHGSISKVEIDTKKGFAYVSFDTRDALIAAIKASPVKVAQGQVQVLERVEKKGHAFRKDLGGGTQGGRAKAAKGIFKPKGNRGGGGGGGGRGGGTSGGAAPSVKGPPATTGS
jgi:regulator of nonsense transcripts 3